MAKDKLTQDFHFIMGGLIAVSVLLMFFISSQQDKFVSVLSEPAGMFGCSFEPSHCEGNIIIIKNCYQTGIGFVCTTINKMSCGSQKCCEVDKTYEMCNQSIRLQGAKCVLESYFNSNNCKNVPCGYGDDYQIGCKGSCPSGQTCTGGSGYCYCKKSGYPYQ